MKALLSLALVSALGGGWILSSARAADVPSSEATEFAIDSGHSSVVFRTTHLGVSSFWGRFNGKSGVVFLDAADVTNSSIELEIEAGTVDTASQGRDEHLRSPDFLSAKEFPVISFRSTAIEGTADELTVTGELELHGVAKEVVATGRVTGTGDTPFGDHRAGFDASFTIDMREFDIGFMERSPGAVGPEVELFVSLECIRQ